MVALKLSIFIIIALIGMSIDRNANNNITKVDPNITDIPITTLSLISSSNFVETSSFRLDNT